ncbi:hypothetical protein S40288_00204 [Stachybotrys chartarum IBT 40288]|nr:hypothetical protein S40288_00204 [Stachybotrys chartarum IBT 40288]
MFKLGHIVWFNAAIFQLHDPVYADERSVSTPISYTTSTPSVCAARTINYITNTLPQSCLTTSWTQTEPAQAGTATAAAQNHDAKQTPKSDAEPPTASSATLAEAPDPAGEEPPSESFMPFEDWKEMMLRRTGQDPQNLRSRKPSHRPAGHRVPPDSGHSGLGEEDEISLNFDNYLETEENASAQDGGAGGDHGQENGLAYEDEDEEEEKPPIRRSKDAGKTCKERFSYSSFDAGAIILKTSPKAKNPKAILAENKDSYMLLECAAKSKYVIVELSDDVLIDTVVLANFEFFSSMIRHFRVSVSDRYPAKADKWLELGTFEARNSRDIQPFLVENPRIWAKYVRIDFLTHFGNEFFCPVSLLRIHGSRLLDSWKEDSPHEEDAPGLLDTPADELEADAPVAAEPSSEVAENAQTSTIVAETLTVVKADPAPTSHVVDLLLLNPTCAATESSSNDPLGGPRETEKPGHESVDGHRTGTADVTSGTTTSPPGTQHTEGSKVTSSPNTSTPSAQSSARASPNDKPSAQASSSAGVTNTTNSAQSSGSASANSTAKSNASNTPPSGKPRSGGANGAPAVASAVQEGFFNAITKRLQQVESNLTLSLKYVEDQSRHMQEALHRAEQRQSLKVSQFLNHLNQTVLAELRTVRDQYDQIWQSTVIALESHRDQSERDLLALGARLNLLADEVVFQKRMAIVQAVLLLSCLFLVIFSRGVPIPYLAPLLDQSSAMTAYANATSPTHKRAMYAKTDDFSHADADELDPHRADRYATIGASDLDGHVGNGLSDQDNPTTVLEAEDQLHQAEYQPSSSLSSTPLQEDVDLGGISPLSSVSIKSNGLRHLPIRKPLPALPEDTTSNMETM